jgi:alkanesulfonate monooxygenase SsuD/methylene tetrahydromethanopterin reductase-like flavin-dependent oxidoreductase (luciferase family)
VLRDIQLDATPDTPADRARALSATGVAGLFTFEGPHARRARGRPHRRPDAARVLGSTPAYRPVLEVEGWAAKQPGLKVLSKTGDLAAMADLVDDTMLATLAVRGTPEECAAEIRRRFGDVAERVCAHFPGYDAPLDQARDLTVARR